jgi:hypothetical protein
MYEPLSLREREVFDLPFGRMYEPLSLRERGRGEGKTKSGRGCKG